MTKDKYEACLIMARSFVNEFIIKHELKKKNHTELFELNNKLRLELLKVGKTQAILEDKATRAAEFVLQKFNKYVEARGDKEVEGNNLAFGLSFVFLLIEHDMFKSLSDKMYYRRVCNHLFSLCEKESSRLAIQNVNVLISDFDNDTN